MGGERVLTDLSFFSGVGGLDLGAKMAGGIQTVGYCENNRYAQGVLRSRIADGGLDDAPIWDDINTFDGKPWRGVDIVSGGFPCQDVSVAGKGEGIKKKTEDEEGTRSGLFYELMRVCREVGPQFILLENVAGLLIYPGAHRVFGELASMGYDAGWKIISASDVGANHERKRIWIVAYPKGQQDRRGIQSKFQSNAGTKSKELGDPESKRRREEGASIGRSEERIAGPSSKVPDTTRTGREQDGNRKSVGQEDVLADSKTPARGLPKRKKKKQPQPGKLRENVADPWRERLEGTEQQQKRESIIQRVGDKSWWSVEPDICRVVNGLAFRVDRLKCCGNGVVALQSLPAWEEIRRLSKNEHF